MLSRIHLGHIDNDMEVPEKRTLPLHSDIMSGRMKEIVQLPSALPADTVCLLLTRHIKF